MFGMENGKGYDFKIIPLGSGLGSLILLLIMVFVAIFGFSVSSDTLGKLYILGFFLAVTGLVSGLRLTLKNGGKRNENIGFILSLISSLLYLGILIVLRS
jgi:hypothetical protein